MLITMQNSELTDKLVAIAGGSLELVEEAIRESAKDNPDGEADLEEVVDYIVGHRELVSAEAA